MDTEAWNFFEDILPPEVAEIVFSFLTLEDIVYVSLVCKTWNTYFDAKDIWRKIIEHYYGELSPKNVDLTQQFKWKRIFITLHNAHAWAKTLKSTTMTYASSYTTPDSAQMGSSGQFIHTLTSSIEIKMAGKLVQLKRDPLTIDNKKWIPNRYVAQHQILSSRDGKYLVAGDQYYLVDGDKLATSDVGDYQATRLQIDANRVENRHLLQGFMANYASFNSRFVVLANGRRYTFSGNDVAHIIFDLKGNCGCVKPFHKNPHKNNFYTNKDYKCNEIVVPTPYGALGVFASQLDPDLIVFFLHELDEAKSTTNYVFYPKMVIWKHGKGFLAEKSLPFKSEMALSSTNFSEHVIDGHHWICFDLNQYTRIIDLNNFSNQFKLDRIPHRMWIPKKNKIILASDKKITVFDLGLKRWTSRMACSNSVNAMTFNKSCRLLFTADWQFVHAFHWETGKLVGSFEHQFLHRLPAIDTIHIGYDQVIILNGKIFLKVPTKCDM